MTPDSRHNAAMEKLRGALGVAIGCACALAGFAQTPIAELGKQRAAASAQRWEVREAGHPVLGPIVFAILAQPVTTRIGPNAVSSNAYVSCERSTARIALELANGRRPDDPLGLKPKRLPTLTCNTLDANGAGITEPLTAQWHVNEIGDVMARGLFPASLRACASIGVVEEVVLPPGWGRESARIEMEIAPYARELDTVFARCGEPSAYPSIASATPASRARPARPARPAEAPTWISARTTTEGRTNVRARPDIRSPLVVRLDPGDIVLVQRSDADWWHARSRPGARTAFEGYIRRDRLVVR
jgi:hypothetical protein